MKKALCVLLASISIFGVVAAQADEPYKVLVKQMQEDQAPAWTENYQAYGRTIKVDVPVEIPDVTTMPILAVEPMPLLPEAKRNELAAQYAAPADTFLRYEFRNKKYQLLMVKGDPNSWDEQKGEVPRKVTQNVWPLTDYDIDTAYADGNDLTVAQAMAVLSEHVHEAYPEVELYLRDIVMYDRLTKRGSGEKLREKGYYDLQCVQKLREIPVMASIHRAFRFNRTTRDSVLSNIGMVHGAITDTEAFMIDCNLWKETAVLKGDTLLVPFDEVKPAVEKLIQSGNIRRVYHAALSYVQFDSPEDKNCEYLVAPAWVVWVDWLSDATEEMPDRGVNGTSLYMESSAYIPIIIDAATGQLFDTEARSNERCVYPHLLD